MAILLTCLYLAIYQQKQAHFGWPDRSQQCAYCLSRLVMKTDERKENEDDDKKT